MGGGFRWRMRLLGSGILFIRRGSRSIGGIMPLIALAGIGIISGSREFWVKKVEVNRMLAAVGVVPSDPSMSLSTVGTAVRDSVPRKTGLRDVTRRPVTFNLITVVLRFVASSNRNKSRPIRRVIRTVRNMTDVRVANIKELV